MLQKKLVNVGRHKVEYEVSQKLLLNVNNFIMPKGLTSKFIFKFVAMFPTQSRVLPRVIV